MRKLLLLLLFTFSVAFSLNAQPLSIYQANLQHATGTDSVTNYSRQITAFNNAELIAVQERTTGDTGWNSPMSAAHLSEAIYLENAPSQGDGPAIWYNNTTISIIQTYSKALSTGTNPSCGVVNLGWDCSTDVRKSAVAAKLQARGRQFYFVSVHLCWSACADSNGSTFSVQRVNQINDLLNWISLNLTGGLDIIISGDMNFAPNYPKAGGGLQKDLFTSAGYNDLWNVGLSSAKATANWGDRDGDGLPDMPLGDLTTRTHDTRRIDYFFFKSTANNIHFQSISVPDSRANCSVALTNIKPTPGTSLFKECPDVNDNVDQGLWDITDDQGVRASDHNFLSLSMSVTPIASISCPATGFITEPVICDGSSSTNVSGQIGWSITNQTDGSPSVDMNFGDSFGVYSKSPLLKSTHTYLNSGTYSISLTVKNSSGDISPATSTSITISTIPAATIPNTQTLTDQGSIGANCTALQTAINNATASNTTEQDITLPPQSILTYKCPLSFPASAGTKYITIRPTDVSWIPSSLVRVTPSLSANMPKIQSPGADQPQIVIEGSNRGYIRFLGIEFSKTPGGHLYQLIGIGTNDPPTFNDLPSHIIVDHCYLHGETLDDTDRAIYSQGNYISVINSYLKDFHDTGSDSQTIATFGGKGHSFVNNYAEAYGENIMFGGGDSSVKYSSTCSSPSTTSCTLSSVTDLTIGTGISFALTGGTTSGIGFSTSSNIGQVADGSPLQQWDQLSLTDGTIVGIVRSVNTASSPDVVTLVDNARVNVTTGISLLRRNADTASIIRSIAGSVITYDPIIATPITTGNSVKYGATAQDIFISRNHFYKNLFYRSEDPAYNGSYRPVVKNSVEFKHAMRALAVANIIENHWGNQGQGGPSVLFTPRNQSNTNPWGPVRDIQFSSNRVKHIADFVNAQGTDTADVSGSSAWTQYITIRDNVIDDLNATAWTGSGVALMFANYVRHLTYTHNTNINLTGGKMVIASDNGGIDILILNNIGEYRDYGFFGNGGTLGDTAIAAYMPDGFFHHNVMTDDINQKSLTGGTWTAPRGGPNFFPATISDSSIFTNYATGNYLLAPASPYKLAGTDGLDIGADYITTDQATINVVSGNWATTILSTIMKGKATLSGKTKH